MKKMLFGALTSLVLILTAAASYAGQRVLDLSTAPGSKVSLSAPQGEVVTFKIINRLLKQRYTITVEERVIPIPPFEKPAAPFGGFAGTDPCAPIVADARSLENAKDEAEVGTIVRKGRAALAAGTCTASDPVTEINEWLRQTVEIVHGVFVVHAGSEIVLTVQREENTWTMVVSGGERGQWLTTYGVSIVPSKDKPYFLKSTDDDKFRVTAEQESDDLHLIPSVFFSWLPRKRMLGDFAVGPTAGLGLSKSKAAVFAGVGFTYNWNLAFITGLAVSPHTQVSGRYKADDLLSETVADDQLNHDVYKPTWVFALTFRFAGNPFGGGDDAAGDTAKDDTAKDDKAKADAAKSDKAKADKAAADKAAADKKAADKAAAEKKKNEKKGGGGAS